MYVFLSQKIPYDFFSILKNGISFIHVKVHRLYRKLILFKQKILILTMIIKRPTSCFDRISETLF